MNTARKVASEVLVRVWKEESFASSVLDTSFNRNRLDVRDRALVTDLVFGVLKTQPYLGERISRFAKNTHWKNDLEVMAQISIAVYSILFHERIPHFAAVSEAVEEIRKRKDIHVAKFANAVLRKLCEEVEKHPKTDRIAAIRESLPSWIRGSLRKSLGRVGAVQFIHSLDKPSETDICLGHQENREEWIHYFKKNLPQASVSQSLFSKSGIKICHGGDLREQKGFGKNWIIQEEGAQCIAWVVDPCDSDRILDACAGRGNKSWWLAQKLGVLGVLDVADFHQNKLDYLRYHMGEKIQNFFAVDWTKGCGSISEKYYDKALVDAPCSGIGTLGRKPEIAIHRKPSDVEQLQKIQIAIVHRVATRVKNGGKLIYAVCSVLKDECEEVVNILLKPFSDELELHLDPFEQTSFHKVGLVSNPSKLLPYVHGTDGYFIAQFTVCYR